MTTMTDFEALKSSLKNVWTSGDYTKFARFMEPGASRLLEIWGVKPGERLLDVACGSGQLALPAARMGLETVGVDIAPNWVASARERAAAEGLNATFDEGDAEALPYEDASFDIVASIFGAMFAPRPEKAAAELLRVCRPGGRILMGNWTPDGFVGNMFRTIGQHLPPPAGVAPPPQWGVEEIARERLAGVATFSATKRLYAGWQYPFPVDRVVDFFFENFGPLVSRAPSMEPAARAALRDDLIRVLGAFNRGTKDTTLLEGEFLSVEAVR
jgi:SAM-dependent methyltransferase